MSMAIPRPPSSIEGGWQLAELATAALAAQSLSAFLQAALPSAAELAHVSMTFLFAADARLRAPLFHQHGFSTGAADYCRRLSADRFPQVKRLAVGQPFDLSASAAGGLPADLTVYPLRSEQDCVGLLGLAGRKSPLPTEATMNALVQTLARAICRLVEREDSQRRLSHLNTYLTVSSMLAQEMGLHELLEIALYCCMEAVTAEAATVLLLDDAGERFAFYQVEGPAKPLLEAAAFPADQGIAGAVLQSGQSEIVNNPRRDPRWYQAVDSDTGISTRNLIAVPLVAGEEKVGVLEVLNKADGERFDEDEHLLLVSVAEEIAFAIRNAKVFEYVANSYCKQRQGLGTCRGCERPLRSWTPCVKYREVDI
jgi:GAF domain-containing protein